MIKRLSLILLLLLSACGSGPGASPAGSDLISQESITVLSLVFAYNPTTNIVELNPYRAVVKNDGNVPINNLYFEFRHVQCVLGGGVHRRWNIRHI